MPGSTPTVPPPQPKNLSSALKRNIDALEERRRQEATSATLWPGTVGDHRREFRQHRIDEDVDIGKCVPWTG
jgi:hypothetical protein